MKLNIVKTKSSELLYIQKSVRNGKKVTSYNVEKLGKMSDLMDSLNMSRDEVIQWAKDKAKSTPLPDKNDRIPIYLSSSAQIEIDDKRLLSAGYLFLQDILYSMKFKNIIRNIDNRHDYDFSLENIFSDLIYARILDPCSKRESFETAKSFLEPPRYQLHDVYRALSIIAEEDDYIQSEIYRNSNFVINRNNKVLYYDCTNYFFEIEEEKGIRKYGASKEHRPNPIVQMGLFTDGNGIPLAFCIHPGNTNEQVTAIPLEKEVRKMLGGTRFIYCADAGLGSYNIRKFNSMGGNAFIVTQSIKKLSDVLQAAVFNDYDYRLLSDDSPVLINDMKGFDRFDPDNLGLYNDFAYKEITADKAVDLGLYEEKICKNGKVKRVKATGTIKQKVIVTFSRKMMEYQRTVRDRQIERAKHLLCSNNPEEIKKGPNDVRRFMKRKAVTKNGEKAVVTYELDEEKIALEEKYDGYYAVATNLLKDPAKDILAISHQRYKIEDCFRVMKTNFSARPAYHWAQRRIKAHFLICFTALLVQRLLECRLDDQGTHVTTENLITTLKNMNVVKVHDVEYRALYDGSNALDAVTKLTGLTLDRLHYQPKELNKKIKKILS